MFKITEFVIPNRGTTLNDQPTTGGSSQFLGTPHHQPVINIISYATFASCMNEPNKHKTNKLTN